MGLIQSKGEPLMCDTNGTCLDDARDWCLVCECCTEWDHENCRACGHEWGSHAGE